MILVASNEYSCIVSMKAKAIRTLSAYVTRDLSPCNLFCTRLFIWIWAVDGTMRGTGTVERWWNFIHMRTITVPTGLRSTGIKKISKYFLYQTV